MTQPTREFLKNRIRELEAQLLERQHSEEISKRNERLLKLYMEFTPAATAMCDLEMCYLAYSRRWLVDYNLPDENLLGLCHYDIFKSIPDSWKEQHQRCIAGEVIINEEEPFTRFDGSVDWVRRSLHPWRNENDEIGGLIMFTEVITEHKEAEKEKERLQVILQQTQKLESIGRLAGGIAHDLNNLLTPILGYSELLTCNSALDNKQARKVEIIYQAGTRARDLVQQLLAFSSKQTLELTSVNLNDVLSQFENLLRRTIREDIDLRIIQTPKTLPIVVDRSQIEQVLLNLTVNAADAMPEGGKLTIETGSADLDEEYAANHPDFQPGRYSLLVFSDTGVGMDKSTVQQVFEPFFTTKGDQGTGLGLATVYGIIKQHNGNIWVYSEPGRGTTFKIYLPVSDQPTAVYDKTNQSIDSKGSETILVVEDNPDVLDVTRDLLVQHGYNILTANNGIEALHLLKSTKADVHLLLTDVVMPKMNGKELAEKAVEINPHLKVLFISGYTDNVVAHHGVLDEGVNFISKPFSSRNLGAKVRSILG